MTEDHAKELIEQIEKGTYGWGLFGWKAKYPLPKWVYVWLEYTEKINEIQAKHKNDIIPSNFRGDGALTIELRELAKIYYDKSQKLYLDYKKLHPEEFE